VADLDRRFQTLDRLEAPDLWAAAVERAHTAEQPAEPWRRRPLAVASIAAAMTVAIVGGVLWLTLRTTAPERPVATTVATTTTTSTTTTTTTTTTLAGTGLDPATAAAWADWTQVELVEDMDAFVGTGHIFKAVAASDTLVVAVGDAGGDEAPGLPPMRDGLIWVSEDGLIWERIVDPDDLEFGGTSLETVVAGGPGFIAGGNSCDSDTGECEFAPALFTSIDGRSWDRVEGGQEVFGERGAIYDLLVRDEDILAMGAVCIGEDCGGAAWRSVDGLDWERIWGVDPDNWGGRLAEIDGGIVSVAPPVWTSSGGTAWTEVPHADDVFDHTDPELGWAVRDLAAGTAGLIAVGNDGNNSIVWRSTDGSNWERVPYDPEAFENGSMMAVIPWGDGFLAAGPEFSLAELYGGPVPGFPDETSAPQLWWSPDGTTWHRISFGEPDDISAIYGITEFRGMVIAVGQAGPWFEGDEAIWVNQDPPTPTG